MQNGPLRLHQLIKEHDVVAGNLVLSIPTSSLGNKTAARPGTSWVALVLVLQNIHLDIRSECALADGDNI